MRRCAITVGSIIEETDKSSRPIRPIELGVGAYNLHAAGGFRKWDLNRKRSVISQHTRAFPATAFESANSQGGRDTITLRNGDLFDSTGYMLKRQYRYRPVIVTSDTRFSWSISWCNWEIFSVLQIDVSCKEVLHSRSSCNSLSTPFVRASRAAASASRILTLSSAPDLTPSISLHLIKSNRWYLNVLGTKFPSHPVPEAISFNWINDL